MRAQVACASCVCALLASAAARSSVNVPDSDRLEAQCIDQYNMGTVDLRRETERLAKNPVLVRLLAEGQLAAPGGASIGPRADLDAVISALPGSADAVSGFSVGGSLYSQSDSAGLRTYGGELRLGVARRVYGIAWSLGSGSCKARRIDLALNLLRWQVGGIEDRIAIAPKAVFASTVGFPTVSWAYSYVNWGWKVGVTGFEFDLAPRFNWGLGAHLEYSYDMFVVTMRLVSRFAPSPAFSTTLGVGVGGR